MAIVFSTTKGMSALALAVAHSRGLLGYDEWVATYWPEFAQSGKERITVRQLLSHQAGLSAIDEPLKMQWYFPTDPREGALRNALYRCLK